MFKIKVNSNINLNNVFKDSNNILTDFSNRTFVTRYGKARDNEEDKQRRIIPDLCKLIILIIAKQLKDKWCRPIIRCSSQKEKIIYQQTLHDDLHAYQQMDD